MDRTERGKSLSSPSPTDALWKAVETMMQLQHRNKTATTTQQLVSWVLPTWQTHAKLCPSGPRFSQQAGVGVAPILQMRSPRSGTLLILCHLAQLVRGEAKPAPWAGFRVLYPTHLLCPSSFPPSCFLEHSVRTEEPTGVVAALTK